MMDFTRVHSKKAMITAQIQSLLDARNYLLSQDPSDMVALAQISEMIVDLNGRLTALGTVPVIPPLDADTLAALKAAVADLEQQVDASAAATQVIAAATTLANLGKP